VEVIKNGKDPVDIEIQHYKCKSCGTYFDDLTDTIFSGSHFGIHQWITVLYLLNLNVSNLQISKELEISEDSVAKMCAIIREGVVKKSLIYNLAEQLKLTNVMLLQDKKVNP
jgi:transposase-like protein